MREGEERDRKRRKDRVREREEKKGRKTERDGRRERECTGRERGRAEVPLAVRAGSLISEQGDGDGRGWSSTVLHNSGCESSAQQQLVSGVCGACA